MVDYTDILPTLNIYVDDEMKELKAWYVMKALVHNEEVIDNPLPNSGFDLATPFDMEISGQDATLIDFHIKAVMIEYNNAIGYYMYPRSSLSKTPLMLANHVGIIDSGYRGNLKGAFRNINSQSCYKIEKHNRLLQICHPSLKPFLIKIVDSVTDIGDSKRGVGGFGSTGK